MNKSQLSIFIPWFLVMIFGSILLSTTNYVSKSNDSRFYSEQVVKYHTRPWSEIIAPKWGNNYGFNPDSYMKDQFPGQMVMGVLVSKLGVPAKHALHIIEMFFQVGSIILMFFIASRFIGFSTSKVILWGLLLVTNAFSYNLRANHESGIMFFTFLACFAGINFRINCIKNGLLYVFAAMMLLFIKGPFIIFGGLYFICGYYFSFKVYKEERKQIIEFLFALFLSLLFFVVFIIGFEYLYRNITGESFMSDFIRLQFMERAIEVRDHYPYLIQRVINFLYYFVRTLIYSLPWTILFTISLILKLKNKEEIQFIKSDLSKLLLLLTFLFCFVFSLSNRIAGRYAFPAFYTMSTWMVLYSFYNLKIFRRYEKSINDKTLSLLLPTLWGIAFLFQIFKN